MSKYDLLLLADEMLLGDVRSLELCITFFLEESRGIGHGRVQHLIPAYGITTENIGPYSP
jgi:hypothetical protein